MLSEWLCHIEVMGTEIAMCMFSPWCHLDHILQAPINCPSGSSGPLRTPGLSSAVTLWGLPLPLGTVAVALCVVFHSQWRVKFSCGWTDQGTESALHPALACGSSQ